MMQLSEEEEFELLSLERERARQSNTPQSDPAAQNSKFARLIKGGGDDRMKLPYGYTDQFLQGATFGFSDELANAPVAAIGGGIIGAGRALKSGDIGEIPRTIGSEFSRLQSDFREGREDFLRRRPVTGTLAELGGGLVTGGAAGKALGTGKTLLGQSVRGAGVGAGAGFTYGLGAAEGNIGERLDDALKGGAFGAAAGFAAPTLARAAEKLIVKPAGRLITRLFPEGGKLRSMTARREAAQKLLEAFQRDGVNIEDAVNTIDEWARLGGKPETLMELGGENVKALAASITNVPGQTKNQALKFFGDRQKAQSARVIADMAEAAGVDPAVFLDDVETLLTKRKTAAGPLYEKLGKVRVPFVRRGVYNNIDDAEEIRRLFESSAIKKSVGLGYRIADADLETTVLNELKLIGRGELPDSVSLKTLDYVKRGLDEQIRSAKKTEGAVDTVRALTGLKRRYIDAVDLFSLRNGFDYAAARSAYAGPSAIKDAIDEGFEAGLKTPPDEIRKLLSTLGESEREGFKRGFVRALYEKFGNQRTGIDRTKALDTDFMAERIRAVFGQKADDFLANLERESQMFQSAAVASPRVGSHTTRLLAGQADSELLGDAASITGNIVSGRPMSAIAALARAGRRIEAQAMLPETREELGRLLLSTDTPQVVRELIREKMRAATRQPTLVAPVAAGSAAAVLSQPQ